MAIRVTDDPVATVFAITPPKNRVSPPRGWASRQRLVSGGGGGAASAVRAMRPAVVVAQCLGLLPLHGLRRPRFKWLSFQSAYYALTALGFLGQSVLVSLQPPQVRDVSSSVKFFDNYRGHIIYMATSIALMLLYLRLARRWGDVCVMLTRVERHMAASGYPDSTVHCYIKAVTISALILTFVVEVVIDNVPSYLEPAKVSQFSGSVTGYQTAVAVWAFWSKLQSKYATAYAEILLVILSAAVAARFRCFNEKLRMSNLAAMTEKEWENVRGTYNEIVDLTRALDQILGPQILVSYAAGLWFLCGGFLLMLASGEMEAVKMLYLITSMLLWCLRVIFATLSMASVYEENQCVRNQLHTVPTSAFTREVSRFTLQASHTDVGLTGMKFFTVTRSVLLTLAGTLVTYEVVLMEFSR